MNGHLEVAEALLAAGAKANHKKYNGASPLHGASMTGHVGVVRALLSAGARVAVQNTKGHSPLHFASQCGHLDVVHALLSSASGGLLVDQQDALGRSTPCCPRGGGQTCRA